MEPNSETNPEIEEIERALASRRALEAQERNQPAAGRGLGRGVVLTPYLRATGLGSLAMAGLVLATAIPAAGILLYGGTFLAVAMGVRALEDLPVESDTRVLHWLADRADALSEKFGVQFYGVASLTAFIHAEISTFGGLGFPLKAILSNPIGVGVGWFVQALVQSILNFVWSALWWLQLIAVDGIGGGLLAAIIVAGWLVWKVLDHQPLPRDDGSRTLAP